MEQVESPCRDSKVAAIQSDRRNAVVGAYPSGNLRGCRVAPGQIKRGRESVSARLVAGALVGLGRNPAGIRPLRDPRAHRETRYERERIRSRNVWVGAG